MSPSQLPAKRACRSFADEFFQQPVLFSFLPKLQKFLAEERAGSTTVSRPRGDGFNSRCG